MLQLDTIYAIPAASAALTDYVFRASWVPEVQGVLDLNASEVLEELQAEGRLVVKCLVDDYIDGHRVAQMHTVWFDGKPVFIVQAAGRGGDDHSRRWLTNAVGYQALLSYLVSKVRVTSFSEDLADPSALVYEDDVFFFYGKYFGERFGYAREPRAYGYQLFPTRGSPLVPLTPPGFFLASVHPKAGTPAPFIRRQGFVAAYQRPLSEQELASNPRLQEVPFDGVIPSYHWYQECSRPENTPVLSV